MTKLKPCPFCESINLRELENDRGDYIVYCVDCGADGPPSLKQGTKEEAVKLWNKRGKE